MSKYNENLEIKKKNSWYSMDETLNADAFDVCEKYKDFLNKGKTEREFVKNTISILSANGFIDFNEVISGKVKAIPGLKVYYGNRGRSIFVGILGKKGPEYGLKIVGSHIDSPRLDIKPTPLYEDSEIAYLKTHYYGGIKKYQWVATPLALHGIIMKKDGETLFVSVGEEENEPRFIISDILPHLGREQLAKPGNSIINAEQLNLIIGSIPEKDLSDFNEADKSDKEKELSVKQSILTLLFDKYGINEKDFMRAELQVVPAVKAFDVGFDRGFIGSYGHDDRICAFTSLEAIISIKDVPEHTALCYFADKEEVGSMGNTGARSNALEYFISELCAAYYDSNISFMKDRCLSRSRLLSADVTAAYDPTFAEVFDKTNAAFAGHGISVSK